jgi:hypothetical protein
LAIQLLLFVPGLLGHKLNDLRQSEGGTGERGYGHPKDVVGHGAQIHEPAIQPVAIGTAALLHLILEALNRLPDFIFAGARVSGAAVDPLLDARKFLGELLPLAGVKASYFVAADAVAAAGLGDGLVAAEVVATDITDIWPLGGIVGLLGHGRHLMSNKLSQL